MKVEILETIEAAKTQGRSEQEACDLLQISCRRIRNWKTKESLEDMKSGPEHAPHALLEEEREAILQMAESAEYVDDSHRVLAAKASDSELIHVSPSSFYREMRRKGLTTDRTGRSRRRKGVSKKPERDELTGANQRWCWDISYLRTAVKGLFLYLYLVLDEYSRKVVAWRVSRHLSHVEGMELIEEALEGEGLESEQIEPLSLYNDRGIQMKAKSFMQMLCDLGISQVFSRPRTPNDNPFAESAFSLVKGDPCYPPHFIDRQQAIEYFAGYFPWYNTERLHGGIGYVTPDQRHKGLDKEIIDNRIQKRKKARIHRLTLNRRFVKKVLTDREKCGIHVA